MDILKYKDYEGTAELDMDRMVCRGKILFIDDLITYEASSPTQLQNEFEAAVKDYIQTCEQLGREPKKPLKGQYNVRISPELHKEATLRALKDNTSLNEVTSRALDAYLCKRSEVNHNVKVTVDIPEHVLQQRVAAGAPRPTTWEAVNHVGFH